MVGSPPANAGDAGSSPGLGGLHMPRSSWARAPQLLRLRSGALRPQLLSPCVATAEARSPGARVLRRDRPPRCTVVRSGLCSQQLERAPAQQRRPNAAKKNQQNCCGKGLNYTNDSGMHILCDAVICVTPFKRTASNHKSTGLV